MRGCLPGSQEAERLKEDRYCRRRNRGSGRQSDDVGSRVALSFRDLSSVLILDQPFESRWSAFGGWWLKNRSVVRSGPGREEVDW